MRPTSPVRCFLVVPDGSCLSRLCPERPKSCSQMIVPTWSQDTTNSSVPRKIWHPPPQANFQVSFLDNGANRTISAERCMGPYNHFDEFVPKALMTSLCVPRATPASAKIGSENSFQGVMCYTVVSHTYMTLNRPRTAFLSPFFPLFYFRCSTSSMWKYYSCWYVRTNVTGALSIKHPPLCILHTGNMIADNDSLVLV